MVMSRLLLLWLPALSAYLLGSAPRSLHRMRMSLVDGESATLPAGLEKEVLRSPLPSAQACKAGDIALVHFTVAKADGTLLHDSRADEGEPLEFSVGVQPSEVVSRAASSPPALRASPSLPRHRPRTAHMPPTHRPCAAHATAHRHSLTRPPPAARRSAGTWRYPACAWGRWRGCAVCHTGLEPQTGRQGPRQVCYSHV